MEKELNENKGIDIMKNTDTMDIIENGNQLMDISGNASTGLTAAEVEENPRARSARLRGAEKLDGFDIGI